MDNIHSRCEIPGFELNSIPQKANSIWTQQSRLQLRNKQGPTLNHAPKPAFSPYGHWKEILSTYQYEQSSGPTLQHSGGVRQCPLWGSWSCPPARESSPPAFRWFLLPWRDRVQASFQLNSPSEWTLDIETSSGIRSPDPSSSWGWRFFLFFTTLQLDIQPGPGPRLEQTSQEDVQCNAFHDVQPWVQNMSQDAGAYATKHVQRLDVMPIMFLTTWTVVISHRVWLSNACFKCELINLRQDVFGKVEYHPIQRRQHSHSGLWS